MNPKSSMASFSDAPSTVATSAGETWRARQAYHGNKRSAMAARKFWTFSPTHDEQNVFESSTESSFCSPFVRSKMLLLPVVQKVSSGLRAPAPGPARRARAPPRASAGRRRWRSPARTSGSTPRAALRLPVVQTLSSPRSIRLAALAMAADFEKYVQKSAASSSGATGNDAQTSI